MPPLDTAALLGPTVARGSSRTTAPILIQVPALSQSPRRRTSVSSAARPRRRRLKREFRIAGASLIVALPMAWGSTHLFRSIASDSAHPAAAAALASFEAPPVVSLRLEADSGGVLASPASPIGEPRLPVVLRGENLPDDGSMEGSAHAGS